MSSVLGGTRPGDRFVFCHRRSLFAYTAPERAGPCTTGFDLTSRPVTRFPALVLAILLMSTPAHAVDVTADDTNDVFAISGATLITDTFHESRDAATCTGCHWRIITVCAGGTLDARLDCSRFPCASTSTVAEVWRAPGATPPPTGDPAWSYRGLVCLATPPVAAAPVARAAHELLLRAVPPLRADARPSPTLTGLPTLFRSGQPSAFTTAPAIVGGVSVVVRATPSWSWDFGHGPLLRTADPGSAWPSGRLRHVFPRRGLYRIAVTCTWHAVYSARGITDLPVDGVITQSAWFDLRVREARRFLRTTQGA